MPKFLPLLMVIFSLLGLCDASYITYQKLNHLVPPCSAQFACETVLQSTWSSLGPVPLSVLGMIFYTTVLIISSQAFLSAKPTAIIILPLGLLGMIFSSGLLLIMGVILKAWCLYCLISAATSFGIGISSILYWQCLRKARL